MTRLSMLLCLACVQCTVPVSAMQWVDGAVVLAPMERAQMSLCAKADQCVIVTRTGLQRFQQEVEAAAMDAAAEVAAERIEKARNMCRKRETI